MGDNDRIGARFRHRELANQAVEIAAAQVKIIVVDQRCTIRCQQHHQRINRTRDLIDQDAHPLSGRQRRR